jgi:hypothetical protein
MGLLGGLTYKTLRFVNKVAFVNEKSSEDEVIHLCFFVVCFVSVGSETYSSSRVRGYAFSLEPHVSFKPHPSLHIVFLKAILVSEAYS